MTNGGNTESFLSLVLVIGHFFWRSIATPLHPIDTKLRLTMRHQPPRHKKKMPACCHRPPEREIGRPIGTFCEWKTAIIRHIVHNIPSTTSAASLVVT